MAELADAQASGACGSNIVWVQVPLPAHKGKPITGFPFFARSNVREAMSHVHKYSRPDTRGDFRTSGQLYLCMRRTPRQ